MDSVLSQAELYFLLGFGFNDFSLNKDKVLVLTNHDNSPGNKAVIDELSYRMYHQKKVKLSPGGVWKLEITDPGTVNFLTAHGVLTTKRYMPTIPSPMKPVFAAGWFEGYGEFDARSTSVRFSVYCRMKDVAEVLLDAWNTKKLEATGYKALDIMGQVASHSVFRSPRIDLFWSVLNGKKVADKFYYHKLSPKAVAPWKSRVTDSGYDLHVVGMTKLYNTPFGAEVYKAKTELAVKPAFGYAFDIVGRSNLPDNGWMFLQGVGICDRGYVGGIGATMMKLSDAPMPDFPWRCLQLVPRKAPIHLPFEESRNLGESDRGSGGFGSTG